ncbi:MAG: hypothetical protein NZM12_10535 [Steroidobacteraceae bacterium]|nr:hypothetical protein [Steroidobacteraceae bacterium]MDW8259792.1 hypothetical protein [Gammaproteobacteria bacterium]
MRITIVRGVAVAVDGITVRNVAPGETVDISPIVAEWLLREGIARLPDDVLEQAGIVRKTAPEPTVTTAAEPVAPVEPEQAPGEVEQAPNRAKRRR